MCITRSAVAAIMLSFTIFSGNTAAAIISRGVLTYDTINEREWLDVFQTYNLKDDELDVLLKDGGPLAGFTRASFEDVASYLVSAGFDPLNIPGYQNVQVVNTFLSLVSRVKASGSILHSVTYTAGRVKSSAEQNGISSVSIYAYQLGDPELIGALNQPLYGQSYAGVNNETLTFPPLGHWLYRESPVPEPSTSVLFAICVYWSMIARRLRI